MRTGTSTGTVNYLLGDHLGSQALTLTSAGARLATNTELRYMSYGVARYTAGATPTTFNFTGQRKDSGSGLLFYNARWYDPVVGRFLQADTIVPEPGNPQALNRYSYTLNNPVKYTDPTGHWVETAFDVLSLGMTINDIRREGLTFWNAVSLVTDVASVALPIVPAGASHAIRAGKLASKAINAADTAADVAKLLNAADAAGDAAKLVNKADNVADAAKLNPFDVPCSFDADTPVLTPSGLTPIQTLQTGDLVFAYDEATGATGIYTITGRAAHLDPAVVTLTIRDETIDTTPEHPFYVAYRGWVEAGRLVVGDRIRRVDGSYGVISTVELVVRPEVMYNLTVADAHTFFVGEDGWLVHNCDPFIRAIPADQVGTSQGLKTWAGEDGLSVFEGVSPVEVLAELPGKRVPNTTVAIPQNALPVGTQVIPTDAPGLSQRPSDAHRILVRPDGWSVDRFAKHLKKAVGWE